jgi:RND family efflux transporter MFP subunit
MTHCGTVARTTLIVALLCSITTFAHAAEPKSQISNSVATTPPGTTQAPANRPATVERQEIRAQLSPRRYTTLAAEIGAKIKRLPVPEGGAFKAGQVLLSFDCSIPEAQVNKGKASLAAAQTTYTANQQLVGTGSIGKVELEVSASEVSKQRAELASNSAILSKCNIQAPFSGRIAEQKVREMQYVQPGQALLEILDDTVLELEFIAPSRWLSWVKVGTTFQVKIDETGRNYPARVKRLGAKVDPVSQSVKMAAEIDGNFPELIAGMSGRVLLTPPSATN